MRRVWHAGHQKSRPYYKEAKEYNAKLVLDKKVTLKLDTQVRDKYGRLLAYVYLDDENRTFNAKLVQHGYAVIMTVPPTVKPSELFLKLQREAAENEQGSLGNPETN